MLGAWTLDLRWLLLLCLLRLLPGLVVSPDSISAFSEHPGILHRNLTLENPTTADITVQLELSQGSSNRRLAALTTDVQRFSKDSLCNGTSRLLLGWRQPGGPATSAHRRLAQDASITRWHHLPNLDLDILDLNCTLQTPEATLGKLRQHWGEELSFAELDQKVHLSDATSFSAAPNDPSWPNLWGMARVDVERAWARVEELGVQSQEVVVAVIDTGVQLDHPDLRDMLWTNTGEIPGNGVDDDGNGYVDDVHGYNFYDYNGNPDDDNGHGSHCAGVIAATANNGIGVAGIASRFAQARIMAIRFLSNDGGRNSDAVLSLEYALANGARISSNSWGGGGQSAALRLAMQRAAEADHLFIAAAGNDGKDLDTGPDYPCSEKLPSMICVAATQADDNLAWYSNYGPDTVHLAAPGSDIYSTMIGSSYSSLSGTSMATPHVAGAAVLAMSAFHLGGEQTRQLLLDSTESLSNLVPAVGTGGILDVENLLFEAEAYSLFWLVPEGGNKSARATVNVPAQSTVQVAVQMGSPVVLSGVREAQVSVSWPNGSAVVPVTYTVQGLVELQLSPSSLETQVTTNATSTVSATISNSGNGTGQLLLEPLSPPFSSATEALTVAAGATATVHIDCRPSAPGEFGALAVFRTNAGLDPFSSTLANATDLGEVLTLQINCTGTLPPALTVENFTGAAEVLSTSTHLSPFQPCVPAMWEPYVPGGSLEADLVLPSGSNSEGCDPHSALLVAGKVVLVSRGTCYFSEKAQQAANAGAVGILIYDNQAPTTLQMMSMPSNAAFPDVPGFLISQEQGQGLLARLQGGEDVRVALRWEGMRAYTGQPPTAQHPAFVTFDVANTGDGPLSWEVRSEVNFMKTQESFYEVSYPGLVSNPDYTAPAFARASLPSDSELSSFSSSHADDDAVLYALPFNFSFFGQSFDQVYVSSNGLLVFNMDYSPGQDFLALPSTAAPNGVVAGFWYDLVCGACRISAAPIVENSNELVVFQFENMSFFDPSYPYNAGPSAVFYEIRLFRDGRIFFMYEAFPSSSTSYLNALIGLETHAGDYGQNLRISLESLFASQSPFAVSFTPWVTAVTPTHGTLAPGDSAALRYDVYSTTGNMGFFIIDGTDGTGSWQSQQRIRFAQDKFQFTVSAGDWGLCVASDCDSEVGNRTRPVDCRGTDGNLYDVDPFCLSVCSDSLPDWHDSEGDNCATYEKFQWCTAEGAVGPGWSFFWGPIGNYALGGYDALAVCCTCGGGTRTVTPAAQEVCSENLTFPDRDCDGIPDCLDACPDNPSPTCTSTTSSKSSTWTISSTTSSSATTSRTRTTSATTSVTMTRTTSATTSLTMTSRTSSETSTTSQSQTSSTISGSSTSTLTSTRTAIASSTSTTGSSSTTLTTSSTFSTTTSSASHTVSSTLTRTITGTGTTRTATSTRTWLSSETRTQTTTTSRTASSTMSTTCTPYVHQTTTTSATWSSTTVSTTVSATASTTASTTWTSTHFGVNGTSSNSSTTIYEPDNGATTTVPLNVTTDTPNSTASPWDGDPFASEEATDGVADRGCPLATYAFCPMVFLATWA